MSLSKVLPDLIDNPAPAGAAAAPMEVRAKRKELGVVPSMKRVDTCAAEFEAGTPYMYSSYDGSCECEPTTARKVRWCLALQTFVGPLAQGPIAHCFWLVSTTCGSGPAGQAWFAS